MKIFKFDEYLKEDVQNLDNADALIIVDVQKEFSKFIPKGYIEKLYDYAKKFKNVIQIWDSNKCDSASYTFPNEKMCIEKKFGLKWNDEIKEFSKILKPSKEGQLFNVDGYKGKLCSINNNHKWFYINPEMLKMLEYLKGKKVIVVGGADEECIRDVQVSMDQFNINTVYNHDYIYSAQTSNKQRVGTN